MRADAVHVRIKLNSLQRGALLGVSAEISIGGVAASKSLLAPQKSKPVSPTLTPNLKKIKSIRNNTKFQLIFQIQDLNYIPDCLSFFFVWRPHFFGLRRREHCWNCARDCRRRVHHHGRIITGQPSLAANPLERMSPSPTCGSFDHSRRSRGASVKRYGSSKFNLRKSS